MLNLNLFLSYLFLICQRRYTWATHGPTTMIVSAVREEVIRSTLYFNLAPYFCTHRKCQSRRFLSRKCPTRKCLIRSFGRSCLKMHILLSWVKKKLKMFLKILSHFCLDTILNFEYLKY